MNDINWNKLLNDLSVEDNIKNLPQYHNDMYIAEFAISTHISNLIETYGHEKVIEVIKLKFGKIE